MMFNQRSPTGIHLPKIRIRPAIDGRRNGVRESLEETTMNLVRSVADFLESSLRHTNGRPVECVVADTCIGGVAEAAQAAEKSARQGVGLPITVTPC
jgi:L-fucose/D-arabinose isomerase